MRQLTRRQAHVHLPIHWPHLNVTKPSVITIGIKTNKSPQLTAFIVSAWGQ